MQSGTLARPSGSTSARSRTPWGGFGDRLLSREHTRVGGCLSGVEPPPSGSQPGVQKPLHHRHHVVWASPSGKRGSRTLISRGRTALAVRSGQPYPAAFRLSRGIKRQRLFGALSRGSLPCALMPLAVAGVGVEPTPSRGSRPRRFACLRTRPDPVEWQVRESHPTRGAYEAPLGTGPPASIQ